MEQALDNKITVGWLVKFAFPTIMSFVFMNIFGMIDGIFVSRIVDPIALAVVNITWPFLSFVMAVGFMFGTGGNALIGKKLGEGRVDEARNIFSLLTLVTFFISTALSLIAFFFPELVLHILGANEAIMGMAMDYLIPISIALPFLMLGLVFQSVFVTEGKAHISMYASIGGGIINIGLNYLLIYELRMGLTGAAIATSVGYGFSTIVGLIYFLRNKKGNIYFVKPTFQWSIITKASTNGVSEMLTMLAMSVTSTLMNNILIDLVGPEGVAAIAIISVGQGILASAFMGYSSGISPIISYNFGKVQTKKLKLIYSYSLAIITALSVIGAVLGFFLTSPLIQIYVQPDSNIYNMAFTGFRIALIGFFFTGFNGFSSAMFTALNNGKISGILSFFRTLVFVVISLLTLPQLFDLTGVWIALPFAEFLALMMTIYFFKKMKSKYHYA